MLRRASAIRQILVLGSACRLTLISTRRQREDGGITELAQVTPFANKGYYTVRRFLYEHLYSRTTYIIQIAFYSDGDGYVTS